MSIVILILVLQLHNNVNKVQDNVFWILMVKMDFVVMLASIWNRVIVNPNRIVYGLQKILIQVSIDVALLVVARSRD